MEIPPFIRKWERELGTTHDKKFIGKILDLAHASAVDSRTAEMNYKCLVRWYSTPEIISKFKNSTSAECWRGCKEVGSMTHLWWDCPKIRDYWKKILQLIKEITKKEVEEDPWVVLFHGGAGAIKQYKRTLTPHLLNAVKRLIPKN